MCVGLRKKGSSSDYDEDDGENRNYSERGKTFLIEKGGKEEDSSCE